MFVTRVIRHKQFTSFICTSRALECDTFKNETFTKKNESNSKKNNKSSLTTKQPTENVDNYLDPNSEKVAEPIGKNKGKRVSKIKFDPFKKAASSLAEGVAKQLGGNTEKVKHELLDYLKTFEVVEDKFLKNRGRRSENERDFQFHVDSHGQQSEKQQKFFTGNENWAIFNPNIMMKIKDEPKLKIWNELEAEELASLSKCSPTNYFEELINWTNEGKLWHFPIDNDQGMEEEAKISFSEHVFMEKHLEPWCPQRGPLRKFMELVLIGLSKNPYLKVEEKKAHIDWFRKYFEDKKKLLQSLGAMGPPKEIEVPKQEENS